MGQRPARSPGVAGVPGRMPCSAGPEGWGELEGRFTLDKCKELKTVRPKETSACVSAYQSASWNPWRDLVKCNSNRT